MTDITVVGGGIVGLSVARALVQKYPDLTIQVLEKESVWASHQTSHNSGVIHSGIYYKPGTLRARLARAGNTAMVQFCREHRIPHEICGKVIVAADQEELASLKQLEERAQANHVFVQRLHAEELREREPHARGIAALYIPSSGIVDYSEVTRKLVSLAMNEGVHMHLNTRLETIERRSGEIRLGTSQGIMPTRFLINCAGLHSDRVARFDRAESDSEILPFRGDYFRLKPEKNHLVRHLIYPVPDSRFPFLGVHLTRSIHGGVHAGPNAVISFAREGYQRGSFNFSEATEMLRSPAFWGYARKHWKHGLGEAHTAFNLHAFARRLQRLVPEIQAEDLLPEPSGVRAQAVQPDGQFVEDFQIVTGRDSLHVCNAASPAATASLELGRYIASQAERAEGFPISAGGPDSWSEPAPLYTGGLCEI